jgi:pilus assembly protein FimV
MIRLARELQPENQELASLVSSDLRDDAPLEGMSLEDYGEELAEADFYARQGLIEEAREILERVQSLFPENEEIRQRLSSLGQMTEGIAERELQETGETEEALPAADPILANEVMDIFNEFKKGLENELEEEDYETHYNLGIAYKEMGLVDDAIREFQSAREDQKRFFHSSNMLGLCYMEKGLYSLAIDVLRTALLKMDGESESFWAMKYDLAEAHEKNGELKEALDYYRDVYGWNSKFRSVSDKINTLKTAAAEGGEKKKKDKKDRVSYL